MGTTNYGIYHEIILAWNLKDVSLDTILILSIALTAFILIIQFIYVFIIIPNQRRTSVKPASTSAFVDNVIAQINEKEEGELKDDKELIAVITAAIYATIQEAVPADCFIVRSIRKIDSRRR